MIIYAVNVFVAKTEALRKSGIQKQLDQMEKSRKRIERVKQEMVSQALADTLQWKQTLPEQNVKNIHLLTI